MDWRAVGWGALQALGAFVVVAALMALSAGRTFLWAYALAMIPVAVLAALAVGVVWWRGRRMRRRLLDEEFRG